MPPDPAKTRDDASTDADRHSRHAAIALGSTLPGDVVLYLLLPMFGPAFGVTLAEVGLLLAANRLVRIVGYGAVVRFHARRGDRATTVAAVVAAVACAAGYATLSGFWSLLPLRLLWGLSFAALNLVTQALATSVATGSATRSGRSRARIAAGPMLALPLGAIVARAHGPRPVFAVLAVVALAGLVAARRLPDGVDALPAPSRRPLRRPGALDVWSFLEGFTLDGLFIVGLAYLSSTVGSTRSSIVGHAGAADGAILPTGLLLALRYGAEIALSPLGGRLAERFGAERLLVSMSLATAVALVCFGLGALWTGALVIVVLRALQLPLLAPIVARREPGPGRVRALAAREVWRDIGAGTGPIVAGLVLPVVATPWVYGIAAALLAWAALACGREARTRCPPGAPT